MKRNHLLTTGALCLALAAASCCRQAPAPQAKASAEPVSLKDHGAEPTVLNIESHTLANENFRTALWTGSNLQVTLMAIPAGGDVGLEQHHDIDQFLRVEEGTARVMMGDSEDNLDFVREVSDDYAILVPAGKWHNIVNTGDKPLKIYSIYAPAEHPPRHGPQDPAGGHGGRTPPLAERPADSCRRVYFTFFTAVSQPVTRRPFLCSVNQKQNDNGNSLQNQVQALRSAVRALHAAGLRPAADVRRVRRIRRDRNGHPVSCLPAPAQHHAGGVQRADRSDLPMGLGRKKVAREA